MIEHILYPAVMIPSDFGLYHLVDSAPLLNPMITVYEGGYHNLKIIDSESKLYTIKRSHVSYDKLKYIRFIMKYIYAHRVKIEIDEMESRFIEIKEAKKIINDAIRRDYMLWSAGGVVSEMYQQVGKQKYIPGLITFIDDLMSGRWPHPK